MKASESGVHLSNDPRKDFLQLEEQIFNVKPLHENYTTAKGGNSRIFRLEDPNEGKEYVIKFSKYPLQPILRTNEIRALSSRDRFRYNQGRKANARFEQEINALRLARDSGLYNIVNILLDGDYAVSNQSYPFFVMEKADTDLKEFILSHPDLDPQEKLKICLEILLAIKQLHGKDIYHRDIKPDNILLFNTKDEDKKVWKVADLGLVYNGRREIIDSVGEKIGPYGWLSPEAMNKSLTERANFGFDCEIDSSSDVFQMGKVFWFVLQGNVPIGQIKLGDLRYNGPQREYLFEMIHGMLNYAKPQRSKVDEVEEVIRLLSHEVGL